MTTTTGLGEAEGDRRDRGARRYLARQGTDRARPPLRYLRRKPGRGLVAVFGPGDGGDIYTVSRRRAVPARGSDAADAAGPTVQQFPVDPKLPHLDTVMAPSEHPALAAALESTAREVHDVPPDWHLLDVVAEPVRYKPGDRCVIRYRLLLRGPGRGRGTGHRPADLHPRRQAVPGAARGRRPPTTSWPGCATGRRSAGPRDPSAWCRGCRWR